MWPISRQLRKRLGTGWAGEWNAFLWRMDGVVALVTVKVNSIQLMSIGFDSSLPN